MFNFFAESIEWNNIVNSNVSFGSKENEFLRLAADLLPDEPFDINSWDQWTGSINEKTGKKGKELFLPLRKALTGKETGPELKYLLPLLTKNNILKKFGLIS